MNQARLVSDLDGRNRSRDRPPEAQMMMIAESVQVESESGALIVESSPDLEAVRPRHQCYHYNRYPRYRG